MSIRRSVLLAEDTADDVALTRRALAKLDADADLEVVVDGARLLERLLPDGGPLPALLLLDLKLPLVGGLEALGRLRAQPRTRTLPVVVLTSSREPADVAAAYARGANSYVRKPVAYDDFVAALRLILPYWLRLNEPPPAGACP